MLNVIAYPSFSRAFNSSSTLRYNYAYNSSTIRERFNYSVLFVTNQAVKLSNKRIRGYFNEGKLKPWHDRPCFHVKYDGNIIVDQNLQTVSTTFGSEYINENVVYTPTGQKYGAIVSPGVPYLDQYTYYSSKSTKTSTCYMYAYMTEDHMYYGFLDLLKGAKTGKLWWFYTRYNKSTGKKSDTLSKSVLNATPDMLYSGCTLISEYPVTTLSTMTLRGGTEKEVDMQLRILNRLLVEEALRPINIDEDAIYGALAMEAINSIRFVDTNSLQFLLELTKASSIVSSLIPKTADLKGLGQAYLSKTYGTDNTLRDVEGYLRGAQRSLKAISPNATRAVRSSTSLPLGTLGNAVFHYKVVYGYYPSKTLNIMRKLDEWALLPNATILWDMIPLSFVADWFGDVGSLVETMDFRTRYQMYDVRGVTRSCKIETRINEQHAWQGMALSAVKVVRYVRQTKWTLDLPKFGYTPPQSFRNVAELTALLVANPGHK